MVLRCTQSTKPLEKPRLTAMADTTVLAGDTVRLYAIPVFVPDSIVCYVWRFTGGQTSLDTTSIPFISHVWTMDDSGAQLFTVKTVDALHEVSDSACTRIMVRVCRPIIALSGDSSISTEDSSRFTISASGPCLAKTFIWSFDNGLSFPDTTSVPAIFRYWGDSDSCAHVIVAFALTQTGIPSFFDTLSVFVRACRPIISLSGASLVFAGDSDRYAISASGPCPAQRYLWSFNNGVSFTDTTTVPSIIKRWSEPDTGVHAIVAVALTQTGLPSTPAMMPVTVNLYRPVVALTGNSTVLADDSSRYAVSSSGARPVKWYLWSFNNGRSFTDTTINPTILKHWSESDTGVRTIEVVALSQTSAASFADSLTVTVLPCKPVVHLGGDSAAFPLDTMRLTVNGFSNCQLVNAFTWSFDGGVSFKDTLASNFYVKQWGVGDTGRRHIWVKALAQAGQASLVSNPDSLLVRVRTDISPLQLPHDTSVWANDTITIVAQVISHASSISRFFWTMDHAAQEVSTIGNTLRCSWSPNAAGAHSLKVRATDDRMTGSIFDSMSITVVTQTPTLLHPRDTTVSMADTVLVTLQASETGAQIVTYLWNIGGLTWTDSGATPQHKIPFLGKDTVTIGVGVRDNRGIVAIDSFHIYYFTPPQNLLMLSPANGDTLLYRSTDSTFTQKRVTFRFSAFDPNGKSDTLLFSLYLGKSTGQLAKIYQGRDSSFIAGNIDTASYSWRLVAQDKFGDSASCTGTFMALLQRTICFAGHSIVSGFDCDGVSGGFRKKVLSGLRTSFGGIAKVKPVGPLVTNYMAQSPDDSCFAVGSYTAKELWTLMVNSFPTLNADWWVIMLGVNGGYGITELGYLMDIVNIAHANNPKAGIYVINGLPYVPLRGQDSLFNAWLSDSVAVKKSLSWQIANVDAYHTFAVNDTPNPALFGPEIPLLHPNQKGYDTLATMILNSMGIKNP